MSVITTDILLTNARRDEVFEWLGSLSNHQTFLEKVFPSIQKTSEDTLSVTLKTGFKKRTFSYIFEKKDDSHGGRRIKIKTKGKRAEGIMNYSLRTMKPSKNTLITITWDYSHGGGLGMLLNPLSLQEDYFDSIKKILKEIQACYPRERKD